MTVSAQALMGARAPARHLDSDSVDVHMREKGPKHLIDQQREYLSSLSITSALIAGVAMTAAHSGPNDSPLLDGEFNQPTVRTITSLLCSYVLTSVPDT